MSNTVTVNQNTTTVVTIAAQGPQGIQGPSGSQGTGFNSGSYTTTSSFNSFTSSYQTDSSSFNTKITSLTSATSSYVQNSQTSSFVTNSSTGSFAVTGSNTFIGNQTISGSLAISGSVTADNLWYRYTLINLPLNTAGTYTIVPVTPGYKFVQAYYVLSSVHIPINTSIENNSNSSVTISNPIKLGTPSVDSAIWKFDGGTLGANEVYSKWSTIGSNVMIDISTDPIIVTIDGFGSDTGVIDVTVTGYLKKI